MSRIEKEITRRINNANTRIKELENFCVRYEESNNNLIRSNLGKNFIEISKQKNKEKILQNKDEIEELYSLIQDLKEGKYNAEIEDQIRKSVESQELKSIQHKKNKIDNEKKFVERQKENYQKRREDMSFINNKTYDIDREYRYFLKAIDRLPDYIQKNLKSMPNNKGYIFMDVVHLGCLPREPGEHEIYFEKLRDGSLKIYEYFKDRTRISIKDRNGNKNILEDYPVTILAQTNNSIFFKNKDTENKFKEEKIEIPIENKQNTFKNNKENFYPKDKNEKYHKKEYNGDKKNQRYNGNNKTQENKTQEYIPRNNKTQEYTPRNNKVEENKTIQNTQKNNRTPRNKNQNDKQKN
jgi:hypothetical protein